MNRADILSMDLGDVTREIEAPAPVDLPDTKPVEVPDEELVEVPA